MQWVIVGGAHWATRDCLSFRSFFFFFTCLCSFFFWVTTWEQSMNFLIVATLNCLLTRPREGCFSGRVWEVWVFFFFQAVRFWKWHFSCGPSGIIKKTKQKTQHWLSFWVNKHCKVFFRPRPWSSSDAWDTCRRVSHFETSLNSRQATHWIDHCSYIKGMRLHSHATQRIFSFKQTSAPSKGRDCGASRAHPSLGA